MEHEHERDEGPPATPPAEPGETAAEAPDFGPGGYLPDRASRRARKIILRAPMGIQWVVGALVVGVVVVVAGWLALRDQPPGEPFVEVPGVVGEASVTDLPGHDVIVTDAGGRPRAFAWAEQDADIAYCPESGLLEAADGRAWRPTGRGVNGTPSLLEHRTVLHDGRLHVDPTTTLDPLPPDPGEVDTACVP